MVSADGSAGQRKGPEQGHPLGEGRQAPDRDPEQGEDEAGSARGCQVRAGCVDNPASGPSGPVRGLNGPNDGESLIEAFEGDPMRLRTGMSP